MLKLLFVYNANSGHINAALDTAHKIFSPSTYNCHLCKLTHGLTSEKNTWTKFIAETKSELIFLHKDEYENQYNQKFTYPVVLKSLKNGVQVLLSHHEIKEMRNVEELITRIQSILNS